MQNFLIRTNESKDKGLSVTGEIREFLISKGMNVSIELMDDAKISDESSAKHENNEYDCVIVLGGDGTMLRAARDFLELGTPLLGINLGNVGYLTELSRTGVLAGISRMLSGDYSLEKRMMLEGSVYKSGELLERSIALNDVVVSKYSPFQAIGFDVFVNGSFLNEYSGDGVIVSSPTGSTGYNLSAGGPIVEPYADLFVLTPVSVHSLNSRSIILSGDDEIKIVIKRGRGGEVKKATAMGDSASRYYLESDDYVVVKKSSKRACFVRLSKESFLETLHQKLQ